MPETEQQPTFPERIFCHQCRSHQEVRACRTRINTVLTETVLMCPRCRKRLKRMRLKDWYDHYVDSSKAIP